MEKITIQYFINKDLNPQVSGKVKRYPVYVQVITLRKNLRFKSNNKIFEYLSEEELNSHFVHNLFAKEIFTIDKIVRDLIERDKKKLITSKNLSLYSKRIFDVIEYNFCKLLLRDSKEYNVFVPDVLLTATYTEINEIIYFFNESSPISAVSEKVSLCLDAFQVLYTQDFDKMDYYYVYDLFEGDKKIKLEEELNLYNSFDTEHTQRMILAMQDLASL